MPLPRSLSPSDFPLIVAETASGRSTRSPPRGVIHQRRLHARDRSERRVVQVAGHQQAGIPGARLDEQVARILTTGVGELVVCDFDVAGCRDQAARATAGVTTVNSILRQT